MIFVTVGMSRRNISAGPGANRVHRTETESCGTLSARLIGYKPDFLTFLRASSWFSPRAVVDVVELRVVTLYRQMPEGTRPAGAATYWYINSFWIYEVTEQTFMMIKTLGRHYYVYSFCFS